jgi:hypothetical protein
VTTIPRWRGWAIRPFDLWPRMALWGLEPVLAYGRLQQRRYARKVRRGTWPPG